MTGLCGKMMCVFVCVHMFPSVCVLISLCVRMDIFLLLKDMCLYEACLECYSVNASYFCVNTCVGKEDGKTCKRVAIRTTIRKDDCRSNAPVRGERHTNIK